MSSKSRYQGNMCLHGLKWNAYDGPATLEELEVVELCVSILIQCPFDLPFQLCYQKQNEAQHVFVNMTFKHKHIKLSSPNYDDLCWHFHLDAGFYKSTHIIV